MYHENNTSDQEIEELEDRPHFRDYKRYCDTFTNRRLVHIAYKRYLEYSGNYRRLEDWLRGSRWNRGRNDKYKSHGKGRC